MLSLAQQRRLRQRGSYQMNVYDAASRCLICFALEPDRLDISKKKGSTIHDIEHCFWILIIETHNSEHIHHLTRKKPMPRHNRIEH